MLNTILPIKNYEIYLKTSIFMSDLCVFQTYDVTTLQKQDNVLVNNKRHA